MYEPQYRCNMCGILMRYPGQCLKCKEPRKPNGLTITGVSFNGIPLTGVSAISFVSGPMEPPKPEPMTLERAIEILNTKRHYGYQCWNYRAVNPLYSDQKLVCVSVDYTVSKTFSPIEAIAIAEWYERNPEGK